jgi:hypothetical protein
MVTLRYGNSRLLFCGSQQFSPEWGSDEVTEWVTRTRQPTITVRIYNLSALTGDQSPIEPIALQVNINCN